MTASQKPRIELPDLLEEMHTGRGHIFADASYVLWPQGQVPSDVCPPKCPVMATTTHRQAMDAHAGMDLTELSSGSEEDGFGAASSCSLRRGMRRITASLGPRPHTHLCEELLSASLSALSITDKESASGSAPETAESLAEHLKVLSIHEHHQPALLPAPSKPACQASGFRCAKCGHVFAIRKTLNLHIKVCR